MSEDYRSFSRYLPSDPSFKGWGWRLLDAGRQKIAAHTSYPSSGHPKTYLFDNNGRRVIDEYQIIYITEGAGSFQSASCPKSEVKAGEAILLFPGEWHAYRPHRETGWTEYWLGFNGNEAKRILETFFSPQTPILTVQHPEHLLIHFEQILSWLKQSEIPNERILASHLPLALSLIQSNHLATGSHENTEAQLVQIAKQHMLRNLHSRTQLETLAKELGVSYSTFRFAFKRQTGYAPREYENVLKLNRSRDLLLREGRSVSETAHLLGYSSAYYFSRIFKQHFNDSPTRWLQNARNTSP